MVASSRFGYNYRAIIGLLRHYHLIIVIRSVSNQMDPIRRVLMMAPVILGVDEKVAANSLPRKSPNYKEEH